MSNCIRLILCVLLTRSVVVVPRLSAQENTNPSASTIVIPFEWKKGDRRTYLITTVEERAQSPKKSTKRLIEVLVAEDSDESVLLNWKLGITTPESGSPLEESQEQLRREDAMKIADRVNDVFRDLILEVNVGKDGVYREIRNWKDVDTAVEKLKVVLKEVLKEIDLDQDKKDRVWNAVMVRQGTRESIERKLTEELQVMLNVTASEFSRVDTEPFEEEVPFMNTLLPAFSIFKVKSFDPVAKLAEISYTRDLNQREAAKVLMEASTKFATDLGKQPPAKGAFDQVKLQTKANYLVELETGWPVKISYENHTTNGKDSSSRKTTIELKSK